MFLLGGSVSLMKAHLNVLRAVSEGLFHLDVHASIGHLLDGAIHAVASA